MDEADEPRGPGIIVPLDLEDPDYMDVLVNISLCHLWRSKTQTNNFQAHAVLDDVLYNVIHDIVLKAHREEKIARANTAAIIIEQKAASDPPSSSSSRPRTPHRIETNAATYEDGDVFIRGNPLVTTKEIRCPKCSLPKLLYPSSGIGSQEPEEGVVYCKRQPYINKPNHDIYGQPFPVDDVKVSRKSSKLKSSSQGSQTASQSLSQQENGSFDSTPPPSMINGRPSFPTTNCSRCSRQVPIRDFRKHLMACMGISSRSSGRAAAAAVQNKAVTSLNGVDKTSQNSGSTSPGSRNGTPSSIQIRFKTKASSMNNELKSSPSKRTRDDFEDDDDEATSEDDISDEMPRKKKKLIKKPVLKISSGGALSRQLSAGRGNGVVKKWKSGKVTMSNGKRVTGIGSPRPSPGIIAGSPGLRDIKRDLSESSQTLSSP